MSLIYRRVTLVVASDDYGDPDNLELVPAILTTLGTVETPYIGGTGILVLDIDEVPLHLAEVEAIADVTEWEFPPTFSPSIDNQEASDE